MVLLGAEKVLLNVDLLSWLKIDFLARCRLLAGPQQEFPSFLFPIGPNPGGTPLPQGAGQ